MSETDFRIVIPARYESSRFPGKALANIDGKPMIQLVYERARAAGAAEVVVATDDQRISDVVTGFGGHVQLTRSDHVSGTDRIAEVAAVRGWAGTDIVVNVQGDTPAIEPECIEQVAILLQQHPAAAIATLCVPIEDSTGAADPNVVKVVFSVDGRALYFSRARIPATAHDVSSDANYWRHIGLYAYRVESLARLAGLAPCEIERVEKLEQLRALWNDMEIRVAPAKHPLGPDVDTPDDLVAVQKYLARS